MLTGVGWNRNRNIKEQRTHLVLWSFFYGARAL